MNKILKVIPVIFLLLLAACAPQEQAPAATSPAIEPTPEPETGGNADVLFVRAVENEDSTWTFAVTLRHLDTGWEDYADGWDVVLPDGEVVRPDPNSPFTRLLTHPHIDEQPFTRSQSSISFPVGTETVLVRAHDLVDGYGGRVVIVQLNQPKGLNFEVNRLSQNTALPYIGVTNQRQDGNRYVFGQIDLPNTSPVDIPLNGKPLWVVGVPYREGSVLWVAALEDGFLQGFMVKDSRYEPVSLPTNRLEPGAPPAVLYDGTKIKILNLEAQMLAPFSHPILLDNDRLAYITGQRRLRIQGEDVYQELELGALKDARVLTDGKGKILLLVGQTDIYDHGVLGDDREAKAFALVDSSGDLLERIAFYTDQVIEGIAPLWADLDGDGQREVVLTISNRSDGAQLVVYSEAGKQVAVGKPIGTGYRWRHQIAIAPFGPEHELELVDVLTPHLGGVVEFFQMQEGKLVQVAEIAGYTSHVINSRNLDMALAADLDRDGQVELLLPAQSLDALGAIQRTADGAEVAFEIPLGSKLSSNLAAVNLMGGGLALAAGLEDNLLRVWMP